MCKLNRDEIIKELEGLVKFITCPEYVQKAFALIIELTEENKRLHATRTELTRVQEENERLSHHCDDCAGCTQWKCDCSNIQADTVRKMQERLKEKAFSVPTVYNSHFGRMIDQIAKEMLESGDG